MTKNGDSGSSEQNKIRWVVNYYGQQFFLTNRQRQELLRARHDGLDVIQIDELTLSTNFSWIAPIEEVEGDRLGIEELHTAKKIAKWLARPIHELGMSYEETLRYTKKNVKKLGSGQMEEFYKTYATGAYPSAKKFMSAVKEGPLLIEGV